MVAHKADQSPGGPPLIFGRKPLAELLRHRPHVVKRIMLLVGAVLPDDLGQLIDQAAARGIRVLRMERGEFENLVQTAIHQGVAAEISPREVLSLKDLLFAIDKKGEPALIVALDQITDPQNFGSILRACESAGVSGVVIPSDKSVSLTATVRKTSAGASEFVPVAQVANLHRALLELKKQGYWIVGTALTEAAEDLYAVDIPSPTVIVLGSEGEGLRQLTRETCDLLLRIPMHGLIQSLNVGQAAAVVLFELARRRAGSQATPSS